jgi:septum formation protein
VPTLVLASASPARRTTLARAGLDVRVRVSRVDEEAVVAGAGVTGPEDVVLILARAKAEDVAARSSDLDLPDDALVLGCDSVLDLDGEPLGKPRDGADAAARWRRMRGRSGVLRTGHWLVDTRDTEDGGTGATLGTVASTAVHFADVTDAEIDAYVATGEPLAVAGAFTVDGLGGAFVRGIEGDHHNVVGVSLPLLRDLLAEVGVAWTALWKGLAHASSSDCPQ